MCNKNPLVHVKPNDAKYLVKWISFLVDRIYTTSQRVKQAGIKYLTTIAMIAKGRTAEDTSDKNGQSNKRSHQTGMPNKNTNEHTNIIGRRPAQTESFFHKK